MLGEGGRGQAGQGSAERGSESFQCGGRRKVALRADALSGPQDRQEATAALRGLIERASCSLPSRAVGSRCMPGCRGRGATMCIFDSSGESASPSAITVTWDQMNGASAKVSRRRYSCAWSLASSPYPPASTRRTRGLGLRPAPRTAADRSCCRRSHPAWRRVLPLEASND